jgi:hypothetical protein
MKFSRLSIFAGMAMLTVLTNLVGCCGPGGGGAKVESKNITTTKTLGEQLMDLQKAYESGAITQDQYNDLKQKAIEQQSGH